MSTIREFLHTVLGRGEDSERLYRLVVSHSPYCIHRIDLEGKLSAMNPAGLVMLGVQDESEIQGQEYLASVGDRDRERIRGLLERAMAGEESEFEFEAINGRHFSSNFVPILDEDGAIVSLMGITQDISERIESANRLRRSEERLQLAMDAASLRVWELDAATKQISWHRTGGSEPGESATFANTLSEYAAQVDPADREAFTRTVEGALAKPGHFVHKFWVVAADGHRLHIEWSGHSMAGESGTVERVVGTSKDVTAQTLRESELWQVQKLESLGVMAGGIAHDFNNLLVSIMGNIDLAMSEPDSAHVVSDALKDAMVGSEHAADLCRQMLAYSGRAPFSIQPTDLSAAVKEMTDLLRLAMGTARLDLDLTTDKTIIAADAAQIDQVIMNLVINAAEASSGPDCLVTVRTHVAHDRALESGERHWGPEPTGTFVVLEVSDRGGGMDDETAGRMFDPFFTSKATGRGLGLSSVLGIVTAHGGCLGVTTGPGQGTRVRVWLPVADSGTPPQEANAHPSLKSDRLLRILIVDDEEGVRVFLRRAVEHGGWTAVMAESGGEALEMKDSDLAAMDAALIDLSMPGMDGVTLARALRERVPMLPIVLSSGFSEEDVNSHIESGAANAFLPKPFTVAQLLDVMNSVIRPAPVVS